MSSEPSAAFVADPIAVVVYDYGKLIESEPQMTVFGPFGGWNEAREYRDRLPDEWQRDAACVVMRDPSIWPDPKKALR